MSMIHCSTLKNATNHLPFSHPENRSRQQRFSVSICTASSDFRKDLSALIVKSASVDEIKKAYRKMALRYHPDVCDPSMKEESTRMFIEIQKVYTSLLDQELRSRVCLDTRNKWESQLSELKRVSQRKQEQRHESWGCRIRAKRHYP